MDFAICMGRRLPRDYSTPDGIAHRVDARARRRRLRGARIRRHRAGAGARVRAARGSRMDRAEYVSDQRRPGFLVVPVGNHLQLAARSGSARARSMRIVPPVPRFLSDRRARRVARARFDAVPVVSDDRAEERDSDSASQRAGSSRVRLRHLPGGLPLERPARLFGRPRNSVAAARSVRRPHACGIVEHH